MTTLKRVANVLWVATVAWVFLGLPLLAALWFLTGLESGSGVAESFMDWAMYRWGLVFIALGVATALAKLAVGVGGLVGRRER